MTWRKTLFAIFIIGGVVYMTWRIHYHPVQRPQPKCDVSCLLPPIKKHVIYESKAAEEEGCRCVWARLHSGQHYLYCTGCE